MQGKPNGFPLWKVRVGRCSLNLKPRRFLLNSGVLNLLRSLRREFRNEAKEILKCLIFGMQSHSLILSANLNWLAGFIVRECL